MMQRCPILQIRMVGFTQQLSRAQSVRKEENRFFFDVTCDDEVTMMVQEVTGVAIGLGGRLILQRRAAGPVRRDVGWPGGISEASYAPMAPSPANKDAQLASAPSSRGASAASSASTASTASG